MSYPIRIFLILLTSLAFNRGLCTNAYGFKDIQIVNNLDSLEASIPKFKNKNLDYIKHLIAIEYSRIVFVSYKSGTYIEEIDSLSRKNSFEFGIAFVQYYKCVAISKTPNKLKEIFVYGEPALETFSRLKDSLGIFLINNNTIRVGKAILLYAPNDNYNQNNFYLDKSIQNFHKLYSNKINELISTTNSFVLRQNKPFYTLAWNNTKCNLLMESLNTSADINKDMDSIRRLMNENLRIVKRYPEYSHNLYSVYIYTGNSLLVQDSIEKGIEYQKLGQRLPLHKESINRVLCNLNIAYTYSQLGDKKFSDSIFKYSNNALAILSNKDFTNNTKSNLEEDCFKLLAQAYDMNFDTKNANIYLNKIIQSKNRTSSELLSQSISTYFEFEKIREQAIENKISTQRNWFGFILLCLISTALFILFQNYKKLKTAKDRIEALKADREKFYSIVSHDLRSPIESYQGLAGTISQLIKEKKYDDILIIANQIDSSGLKLKTLIKNLLEWSLEQQNLFGLKIQSIHLLGLFDDIIPAYETILSTKGVEIKKNIDPNAQMNTDKNSLNTILRNCIDNAIKNAIKNSVVNIEVIQKNSAITISISNVTKLSIEQFEIIQELFTSEQSWQPNYKGLGLGMILIKDFSIKLGLKVEVSRNDNEFIITLLSS